jgi:hypothetical protein
MTMFKKCALAAAVGLLATGAVHAQQRTLADLAAVPASNTLFISGASAPRDLLVGAGTNSICNAGTKSIFRQGIPGTPGNTIRLYGIVCQGNAASGLSGQNIAIYYSPLGSGWGVSPVRRGLQLPRLNTVSCPAGVGNATDTGENCTLNDTAVQAVPDVGVSDLSKNVVGVSPNVPTVSEIDAEFGASGIITTATKNSFALPMSSSELSSLTENATGGTVFAVTLNAALRNALIARTGIYPTSVVDGATTYATLSKAEIAGLFQSGNAAAVNPAALLGIPAGDFGVCRRLTGSGTQAVANQYFLNNPGSSSVGGSFDFASFANDDNAPTYAVVENIASSDVNTCMGGSGYRMGIVSIENAPPAGGGFAAINGVAPTKANVRNGVYDYYSEQVLTRNTLSGGKLSLFTGLDTQLSSSAVCSNAAAMVLPGVTVPAGSEACQMRSSRVGNQAGVNARR